MSEWADIDTVTDSIAREVPRLYGLSSRTHCELLGISENANFVVHDPESDFDGVLRVHRHGYHELAAIESEIAWMRALRRSTDVLAPDPLAAANGEFVVNVPGGQAIPRRAAMFTRVPGRNLTLQDATPSVYQRLGSIMARLHEHSKSWTRPEGFYRYKWDLAAIISPEARFGFWGDHPALSSGERKIMAVAAEKSAERIQGFSRPGTVGLVHSDLHVLNVMVADDDLWCIDFDDCGISWFMYDIAPLMSCLPHGDLEQVLTEAWIRGYEQVRALSDSERSSLADFVMLRRLLVLGWSATHPEAQIPGEWDDFIQATVAAADAYNSQTTRRVNPAVAH